MPIEQIFESYGNKIIAPSKESSSSSGGHTILNPSGTAMEQEDSLQFKDSHVTDDSTNSKTVVETFKAVTESEYSSETEDGAYIITDGDGATIEPASDDYVEVTADGEKTYATLLNELYALVNKDKLTNSYIIHNYVKFYFGRIENNNDIFYFTERLSTSNYSFVGFRLRSTNSQFATYINGVLTDGSSSIATNGMKITLYYGNKKATVDLQTTANRCLMNNEESVESAFTWKYLTNITDHNAHAINVNFRELFLIGLFGGISATLIPLVASTRAGYYNSSSDYGDMYATCQNGELTIVNYKISGTDQIARGVNVYYR